MPDHEYVRSEPRHGSSPHSGKHAAPRPTGGGAARRRRGRVRLLSAIAAAASLLVGGGSYAAYAGSATPATPAASTMQRLPLPANPAADADAQSVTVGVRFTPTTDGVVMGVGFHRATTANTGRVVQLWDGATGKLVASGAPLSGLDVGWVQQQFASSVAVKAGHQYVASYFTPAGHYSSTEHYWDRSRQAASLTAPVAAGVYRYGSGPGFPDRTWHRSDYAVTPLFVPGATAAPVAVTAPVAPTTSGTAAAPTPTTTTQPAPPTSTSPAPTTTTAPAPGTTSTTSTSAAAPSSSAPPAASTSTSSTGLMGWQINATNVGLAPLGLSCSSLPAYTGSLKPAAGARISDVRIAGNLDLSNGDIVISRSCIQPASGDNRAVVSNDVCGANECVVQSARSVTITDSEIDASRAAASTIGEACAFRGVGTLQRNYVHGMGSGICFFGTGTVFDALAEQNYVTGLRSYGSSHNEAATVRDFRKNGTNTRKAQFINNRLDCESGNETGGLFIQPTWDDIYNVWVQGNYIEGGGYNLYLENKGGVYGNVHATDNRFRPTGWGPAVVGSGTGWNEWTGNYLYSSSASRAQGTAVAEP